MPTATICEGCGILRNWNTSGVSVNEGESYCHRCRAITKHHKLTKVPHTTRCEFCDTERSGELVAASRCELCSKYTRNICKEAA